MRPSFSRSVRPRAPPIPRPRLPRSNFSARAFLRLIGQYVDTRRDAALYLSAIARRDASFTGSALFAFKLNWQTVLFLGYGDNRALSEQETLERSDRQFFLKLSYALQR
ncbi:MAG: hypothetical protein DMF78_06765 [Acidobacteria bacterium]|nr:MAG: hypothetical protein DMF78_06765 [Acidobacteriota bacterium]